MMMENNTDIEYRMYCLAERHLSSIQKAIQSSHAIVEYSLMYGNSPEYKQWAKNDKTIIILDGGNSIDLEDIKIHLIDMQYPFEVFYEPDMGNFMTAIAFLVPNKIYDYQMYGTSYNDYLLKTISISEKEILPSKISYNEWLEMIGGKTAESIKAIISSLRIAI